MRARTRPLSHRRRFAAGLAVALLAGVGLCLALVAATREEALAERAERKAVITLRALAELVERAAGGEPGEAVRRAVARFAATHPEVRSVRVVTFEGIRLEASSDPADRGARAAPRRLERDEKPLYDLGQKLRAAVAENRESTAAAEAILGEEIALERRPDGGFALAAPVERGGEVLGLVQMRTEPAPQGAAAPSWLPFLAAWLAPVLVFALLALALGERRAPLAAAAAALLAVALGAVAWLGLRVAAEERRETGRQLAAHAAAEAAATRQLLAELGLPEAPPLAPGRWDVDVQRRPRQLLAAAGTLDEGRLGELVRRDASRLTRAVAWIAAAALALLAFVGFGGAARVGRDLVAHRAAYVYTVPALLAMLLLVFFPFLYGLVLSFTNANIYNSNKPLAELWVGLANFGDILADWRVFERTAEGLVFDYQNFYWTLGFTTVWTVSNVLIGVSIGLALALALNTRGLRLRPLYRVLLILPWAMPNYISALIFRGMFHQQFGVVNQLRQLFGAAPLAWFDSPLTSFLALLTTNGWLSFPFMMVVSLGALQSIPADLYEAARVDGATRWQQFRSITLPSLRPALVPAVILSVIWTFNQFNVVYLVSAGEPAGATEILITQAFKIAFEQYRYGYAAAYSMLIFLILLAYGIWQNRVTKATEAIA